MEEDRWNGIGREEMKEEWKGVERVAHEKGREKRKKEVNMEMRE